MGNNTVKNFQSQCQQRTNCNMTKRFVPVSKFKFMEPFEEDSTNGLYFNEIYLPEEILADILSFLPPEHLLHLTLVCKKWCNIIKSENFWMHIYNRHHHMKAKKLPWYVYYNYFTTINYKNLITNGNGQLGFDNWKIVKNFGDQFRIENPPCGSDPLPPNVPEFNGHTSCFATSFFECNKIQEISLEKKRLLRYILEKFKPHIYASEWVAGRFDCGCIYKLTLRGHDKSYREEIELESFEGSIDELNLRPLFYATKQITIQQWEGKAWEKVEVLVEDYRPNIDIIIFEHEGRDTQFWKGHYGSKMAGGVVKIVFESIEPLAEDQEVGEMQEA